MAIHSSGLSSWVKNSLLDSLIRVFVFCQGFLLDSLVRVFVLGKRLRLDSLLFRPGYSLLRVFVLRIHSHLEANESSALCLKPHARECLNELILSSYAKPDCRGGCG